jgi:regulator of sigma E protease
VFERFAVLSFLHSGAWAIPQLALVLGIMVLVHEFGHFAVAKLCGVRVETFAIGFGKRLVGFIHNGTDYCINLIPLGGYVKMAGVGDEPISGSEQKTASSDPGELQNHPRWQRTLITLAGPFSNFLLAFVLLLALYMTSHPVPAYMTQAAVADYVLPNSPMAATGLKSGDQVLLYNTAQSPTPSDLQNQSLLHLNGTIPFAYLHNGQRVNTALKVVSKGAPSDFDFLTLGMIPVMQTEPIEVSSVEGYTTGPAARAGLRAHDKILSVDGIPLHSVEALIPYMQQGNGRPMQLMVERAARTPSR